MRFGLMESTIDAICGVLAHHPAVEKAVLYGSRAKGNFKPGSDIDLTLFGAALDARQLAMIDEELDDLLLPYQIDLSIFAQLDHAKLREHIERVGVEFYRRENGASETRKFGGVRKDSGAVVKEGWQSEKLGDVCVLLNRGISPKYLEQGGVCVLNQKCIRDHRVNYEQSRRHDSITKSVNAERFIQLGDVLVNSTGTGTLGRVAQIRELPTEPTTVDSHVTIIRPKPGKFFQDFFGYMLIFIEEAIKEAGEGCGGQTELARSVLAEKFTVCYPISIDDQKRVVAILDEAFDGIATAKANAEKNLQNARTLFESHLQAVFSQQGDGWVEKSFADICHKITDGTHHSPKTQFSERRPGLFPYITSKNIRNNFMDLSNVAYIESSFHDEVFARCQPSLGDVLLTKDGASTGNVTLNTLDEPFSLLSSVCLIKTKPNLLKPAFLCYYLQSPVGLACIVGQMTGAAIKRIVLKDIKKAVITFPPLNEQEEVVSTLNSLLAETQRLESIYQQKLAALDELKKSLLHQAFSGLL